MAGLSKENPLKNVLNRRNVAGLASRILEEWPDFPYEEFVGSVTDGFEDLGFLERSVRIRECLRVCLPRDPAVAIQLLIDSLGPELPNPGTADWDSFIVMPQCGFVAMYGKEHFDLSMHAFYEMTKRFTAEGDLRALIEVDPERAIALLHDWCADPSPHVRRLVSEGTRPRLPLAGRIRRFQTDPRPVLALLERLKDDPSDYVRRSVANNVNDIAKDNPALAVSTLQAWWTGADKNRKQLVRHAARSLIKQGNPEILGLFGYETGSDIQVANMVVDAADYAVGDTVAFSCTVRAPDNEARLLVDYAISYPKAKGKRSDKVFKLKTLTVAAGQEARIEGRHMLRNTSNRTHYPGTYYLALQINGKRYERAAFELSV